MDSVADLVAARRRGRADPRQRPPGGQPAGQERARRATSYPRCRSTGAARRPRRRSGCVLMNALDDALRARGIDRPTRHGGHPRPGRRRRPRLRAAHQADRALPAVPRRPPCSSSTARPGRTAARRAGAAWSPRPSRARSSTRRPCRPCVGGRLRRRRQRRRRHPGGPRGRPGAARRRGGHRQGPRRGPARPHGRSRRARHRHRRLARRAPLRHPGRRAARPGHASTRMRALAAEGHFASGSMGPKVDAACRFVEQGGRYARHHRPDHDRRRGRPAAPPAPSSSPTDRDRAGRDHPEQGEPDA